MQTDLYGRQIQINFILITLFLLFHIPGSSQNIHNTAYATATATIITEMAGVEKLSDITFTGRVESHITENAALNIIGTNNAYSVTLSSDDIILKEKATDEIRQIDSYKICSSEANIDQTLAIPADTGSDTKQSAGKYTSLTPLAIIVNYN